MSFEALKHHSVGNILRRLYCRVVTDHGSPDYIARGWALGMLIGCVIPMGFQLLISVPLSFPLRASKIGAALGTLLTNPLTVWFIYPAQCYLGSRILGGADSIESIELALDKIIRDPTWADFANLGTHLLGAFFIGGIVLALILTPATYYTVRLMVQRYRQLRLRRRTR